jgi:hypothetical protein
MGSIAIARPDTPTKVLLWCTVTEVKEDGTIVFDVINGCWAGSLFTDNTLLVHGTEDRLPAIKVWEGKVPKEYGIDYNKAICWINTELSKNEQ